MGKRAPSKKGKAVPHPQTPSNEKLCWTSFNVWATSQGHSFSFDIFFHLNPPTEDFLRDIAARTAQVKFSAYELTWDPFNYSLYIEPNEP